MANRRPERREFVPRIRNSLPSNFNLDRYKQEQCAPASLVAVGSNETQRINWNPGLANEDIVASSETFVFTQQFWNITKRN